MAFATTAAVAADLTPYRKAPEQPPPAQASGYVELYGGWAKTKIDGTNCFPTCFAFTDRVGGSALGGAGRATYWWAPNLSVQLDAQGEGTSYRYTSVRFSNHNYLVGSHINWRDPQRGLLGLFGGAGDTTASTFASIRHGLIGLEGQAYWGAVTLYGQVGYDTTLGDVAAGFDGVHTWFVRGTARFYLNPNVRLEGTLLYAKGEFDFSAPTPPSTSREFDTWLWRAKAEYKLGTAPFSIFAAYEGSRTTMQFASPPSTLIDSRATDHRIMGGLRLYLGENTLQWNDHRGTTLDMIAPLTLPSLNFGGAT